jgi:DNA-binding winged helix-turn-helix (wHTH) protein
MDLSDMDIPVLIGQTGPLNGQRWGIDGELVVGRDAECGVVVPDRQVSRFHARLTATEDGVTLEDLGSKNGTFHNSNPVTEAVVLQDGDVIQVALVQSFVYLSSDSTMPLETSVGVVGTQPGQTGNLVLDTRSRRVWLGTQEILPPLSVPQFRLLQMLYDKQGQSMSRQDIIEVVWGDEGAVGVSDQALDALVRRLRDRLAELDPGHMYIVTVRGHGLRLDNPQRKTK